jgi:PII-like signaling protein
VQELGQSDGDASGRNSQNSGTCGFGVAVCRCGCSFAEGERIRRRGETVLRCYDGYGEDRGWSARTRRFRISWRESIRVESRTLRNHILQKISPDTIEIVSSYGSIEVCMKENAGLTYSGLNDAISTNKVYGGYWRWISIGDGSGTSSRPGSGGV